MSDRCILLRRRGLTLAESLVTAAIGCLLIATLIPLLAAVGGGSGEARSLANLRFLVGANEAYGQTFSQRQFTAIPENAGLVNGDCATYIATIACPPQQIVGWSANGGLWGFYLPATGFCSASGGAFVGNCDNWGSYVPMHYTGSNAGYGSFRLPNVMAFNQFVDGRFYSDVWYSPNDRAAWHVSAMPRDEGAQFELTYGILAFSSYCFSSAAMFHPDVYGATFDGYRAPTSFPEAYTAPAVTQCIHPELKTRMIEHNWNLNSPSYAEFAVTNALKQPPYNASSKASPLSMFFDGSVRRLRNVDAIADDESLFQASGGRLWSRTSPLGTQGYLGLQAIDSGPRTSHTTLTIDGLLGRDVLTVR